MALLKGISAALAMMVALRAEAAPPLPPTYWQSQTSGLTTPKLGSQEEAVDSWLALAGGRWMRNGSCGQMGTSNYRVCPLIDSRGQTAGVDVPLMCPVSATGAISSPDGINCPTNYVSSDPDPRVNCGGRSAKHDHS